MNVKFFKLNFWHKVSPEMGNQVLVRDVKLIFLGGFLTEARLQSLTSVPTL